MTVSRVRLAGWAVALLLGSVAATAAQAQLDDPPTAPELDILREPGERLNDHVGDEGVNVDTAHTPVARRPPELWTQLTGARWPGTGMLNGLTSFDTDFFTVAFRNTKIGFAGGSACRTPADPDRSDLEQYVATCPRVPVIYRITNFDGEGLVIEEALRPAADSHDPGGYVGAIHWIDADTALAVGGDGVYPRRELHDPTTPANDPAGMGRAWLYYCAGRSEDGDCTDQRWRELENKKDPAGGFTGANGDEIPDAMRGMTALAVVEPTDLLYRPRTLRRCGPADLLADDWEDARAPAGGLGFAGALGQLWEWRGGRFTRVFTEDHLGRSPFRFRVRGIALQNRSEDFYDAARCKAFEEGSVPPRITVNWWDPVAVTAGCCAAKPDDPAAPAHGLNFPRTIASTKPDEWTVSPLDKESELYVGSGQPLPGRRTFWSNYPFGLQNPDGPPPRAGEPGYPEPGTNQPPPSAAFEPQSGVPCGLNLPGCPIQLPSETHGAPSLRAQLDTGVRSHLARFVAQDGVAVGSFLPGSRYAGEGAVSGLYRMGSYGLNAVDNLPADGLIWVVGDRGAIIRYGEGSGVATDEPEPPSLGRRVESRMADSSAYTATRPPVRPDAVGPVPPIAAQPLEELEESRLISATPTPVNFTAKWIVMSRDGSEGWAAGGTTLFHYRDGIWRECDPDGEKTQAYELPPDPECAGFKKELLTAARVPYENDDDPTNDDRFVVVGLSTERVGIGMEGGFAYRYDSADEQPHWKPDPDSRGDPRAQGYEFSPCPRCVMSGGPFSLAFSSPDEGWAVSGFDAWIIDVNKGGGGDPVDPEAFQTPRIYRFHDDRWILCSRPGSRRSGEGTDVSPGYINPDGARERELCADWNERLPLGNHESHLQGNRPPKVLAAGDRVYMYGTRELKRPGDHPNNPSPPGPHWPFLLYRDIDEPCEKPGDPGCWREDAGGHDPGCMTLTPGSRDCAPAPETATQGRLLSLSVLERPGDPPAYEGWAAGDFTPRGSLRRLTPEGDLVPWHQPRGSAGHDYGIGDVRMLRASRLGANVFARTGPGPFAGGPLRLLDEPRERFDAYPLPIRGSTIRTIAPDNRGGLWVAASTFVPGAATDLTGLFQLTRRVPRAVFEDAEHPVRERITAIAGGGDGSVWVATNSNLLYRRDQLLGWERVPIPGWDPGSLVTAGSGVNALAVGVDGRGVAVGNGGRVARLSPESVVLDRAAGTVCGLPAQPPCGTSRDLVAVAVGPDGSAIAAGTDRALLWRPAGGEFRTIERPEVARTATLTAASLPSSDVAYLTAETGQVFRGTRAGESWTWDVDNLNAARDFVTRIDSRRNTPLVEIDIAPDGSGYARGSGGELFERQGDHVQFAWRRIDAGFGVQSIALPPGRSEGALFGGSDGLVMVRMPSGEFEPARIRSPQEPVGQLGDSIGNFNFGVDLVRGLAIVPGAEGGVDAWAATGDGLLRHSSGGAAPGRGALRPLPDTPAPREEEISIAAFGKSDCWNQPRDSACPEYLGPREHHEQIQDMVVREIVDRARAGGGPDFAVFTGDVSDTAGRSTGLENDGGPAGGLARLPTDPSRKQRRWRELIAERLLEGGVPLFGAIGEQDLSQTDVSCGFPLGHCDYRTTRHLGNNPGPNLPWRAALAPLPAPWGLAEEVAADGLRFRAVPWPQTSQPVEDAKDERPTGGAVDAAGDGAARAYDDNVAPTVPEGARHYAQQALQGAPREDTLYATLGGARTHYAVDVVRDGHERPLARLVVVDSSWRSLAVSDPHQNPQEPQGQAAWLEQVLCEAATDTDVARGCTRAPGVPAVVVSNTPTYSYATGHDDPSAASFSHYFQNPADLTGDTQQDAAAFEAILMKNRASLVVSGRIGWNGLYWATAPGVHEPCPGGDYQTEVPPPGARLCGRSSSELPVDPVEQGLSGGRQVAEALSGLGAPPPAAVEQALGPDPDIGGVLPFVVASGAGGKFGGDGDASDGFWRGYTIIRLTESGDPRQTIVEQRPVLAWIGIRAVEHTLRPGQRLTLRGYGREAGRRVGSFGDTSRLDHFRYVEFHSQAITHRYDLVIADPDQPWLPLEDANGDYVPVPAEVATVNRETGAVKAGRGKAERTFAIAMLSVGDKAAGWPLAFEPRRAFAAQRQRVQSAAAGRALRAPAAQPPVRPAGALPPPPAPPPATPTSPLASQTLQPPQPPSLPALPSVPATAPPPPPQLQAPPPPPAPPAPPNVPPQQQPQPLALGAKLQAVSIVPSVNPPAPPPVNPAPPAGSAARKEAKQRQAATAKSEEGAGKDEGSGAQADVSPMSDPSHGSSRLGGESESHSFTRLEQQRGSPVGQVALYGGGTALMALVLALGWSVGGPRARRRLPAAPAAARAYPRT